MQDFITVTGMILSQAPIGEYDRRICLLTKEKGKISAFVKGVRRQNSRLLAATNPFSFGQFKLYAGKNSYNVVDVTISNYFDELRTDYIGAYYGMYFMEVADYCTRENNDEKEMLKLLYQSLRALISDAISNELIRRIYEIKTVVVNGEYPGLPTNMELEDSTKYTIEFIAASTIEKLYTFTVTDDVLKQLKIVSTNYFKHFTQHNFKSLEILETLC